MRDRILYILRESIEDLPALNKKEIYLMKFLNKKKDLPQKELKDYIKTLLRATDIDPSMAPYYYLVFVRNYREDGDYENLKKKDFIDPKESRQIKTTNEKALEYAKSMIPFKGSNLDGDWSVDSKNVPYYVINSYGWYPIYLYKDGVWYVQIDSYSNATAKQMSRVRPYNYNNDLKTDVVNVTRSEMDRLIRGATKEEILSKKVTSAIEKKGTIIDPKMKTSLGGWRGNYWGKVKYKISDIVEENNKIVVIIDIDDAGATHGASMIPSKGAYLRGEVPGVTKEKVEELIIGNVAPKLREFTHTSRIEPTKSNVEYKFNHLKEQK